MSWYSQYHTRFMFGECPRKTYTPEYLVPTVQHAGGCVMIWTPISRYSTGPIITLNGRITASDYMDISGCSLWPRCFLMMKQFFKIIHPYTQPEVLRLALIWYTSTSSLASTIDRLKYHQNIVVSFREYGEKHTPSSIISQTTTRCSSWRMVQ